jgi:predicted permease
MSGADDKALLLQPSAGRAVWRNSEESGVDMNFDVALSAVESVLTLCLIVCVGYVLARRGWFGDETKALLPKLVTLVALPPYVLYHITSSFTRDQLLDLAYGTVVPFVAIFIIFSISMLAARLIRVQAKRRGIFCMGFTCSNSFFMGVPVNIALFGEASLPFVLLYHFVNSAFFWSMGNYLMALDGGSKPEKLFSPGTAKLIVSPPMLGILLGVALVVLGLQLPAFLSNTARYLGGMTTPMILIALGVILQGIPLYSLKVSRELIFMMLGRFVISPLVFVALICVFPVPELMRNVFIIQASLPVGMNLFTVASYHGADAEFSAVAKLTSTLLALVVIPVVMILVA